MQAICTPEQIDQAMLSACQDLAAFVVFLRSI